MSKKVLFFLLSFLYLLSAKAQTTNISDGILFQAIAVDANGVPAKNKSIYIKDAIIKSSPSGEVLYTETFQVTTSADGIFTIVVGKGQRVNGVNSLSNINWSIASFYLNIKIAITPTKGGSTWDPNNNYIDMGTSQFWTVPFAMYAQNVAGQELKLNSSDTASMLNKRISRDTVSLSDRINTKANLADVTNLLALKANITDLDSKASKLELDLKANATDVTSSLALKANATDLDSKASKTELTSALADKASLADISNLVAKANAAELDLKASKTELTNGLAEKANAADVTSLLAFKANATDLDTKASKAELTSGLADKANAADVTSLLALKANASDLDSKASKTELTTALTLKANATDLDTKASKAELDLKANTTDVTNSLTLKANTTDLDAKASKTELDLKANTTDVTTALALKANTTDLDTKASKTELTNGLAEKVSTTELTTALALKANTTDLDTKASKTELDLKASKIELTNGLAEKVSTTELTTALALKANATELDTKASKTELDLKANAADVTTALALKANAADVTSSLALKANTTDVTTSLALKANATELAAKAPLASPTFTGTITGNLSGNVTGNLVGNVTGNATNITGTVAVANGGTGQTSALTQGGIMYGSTSTTAATTSAGTIGQILISNGTASPSWISNVSFVTATATYSILNATALHYIVTYVGTSTPTFTLPAPASNIGKKIIINYKNTSGGNKNLTINPNNNESIQSGTAGTAYVITVGKDIVQNIHLVTDGTNWFIIN